MPFKCGQSWTGTSRSGHSPSYYTVDWNRTDDLGQPVLASAPGVVTRAVSLTTSYGRHVIVDYKANAPSPNAWDSDRPAEPQVPLYATQHRGHVAGVLFGNLRPGELKFAGHVESKDLIPGVHCDPNLRERIEGWRSVLTNLGAAYAAGRAEVDPKGGSTCDLCGLTALCRIREIHIAEESGDA